VTSIELREPDGGKTAGLVVGIVAVLALGVFLGIQAILNDPSY
jgi:multisubunit Na+/H+ antiporter MnhB subunit